MIIEAGIAMLSQLASLHSWASGINMGKAQKAMLAELARTRVEVERLSEHILYASSVQQIQNVSQARDRTSIEKQGIRELLDPVQRSLRHDLLSTALAPTPVKMRHAFQKDPWEVMFSIRPAKRIKKPDNPDAIPVLFEDNGLHYVGWQMKSILPTLFQFNYDSSAGLYRSKNPGTLKATSTSITDNKGRGNRSYLQKDTFHPMNLQCRIGRKNGGYTEIVWEGEILNVGPSPARCRVKVGLLDKERQRLGEYVFDPGVVFDPGKPKGISDFYWMTSTLADQVATIAIKPVSRQGE